LECVVPENSKRKLYSVAFVVRAAGESVCADVPLDTFKTWKGEYSLKNRAGEKMDGSHLLYPGKRKQRRSTMLQNLALISMVKTLGQAQTIE
jgi:hypothetical protein